MSTKTKSFGERLVGIDFNPSNNDKVHLIKTKMAEIANIIHDERQSRYSTGVDYVDSVVINHTLESILQAQMAAVKYVTLKPIEIPEG
jgi:hypothetical protein